MNDPAITLSRLQACPFCERVVVKLDELGLDYRSRFVEPMHSDRDVVKRIAGTRTVPVIVDERTGVTMAESANIVEYLDRTYGESTDAVGATESAEDEPRPAAFVVDDERTIQYAWVAGEWPDLPDYDALESALEQVA
jgi:glutathione S-transferase